MSLVVRILGSICGVAYWAYLSVPRYDMERRSSTRYRKALKICKGIWIASGCMMLALVQIFPAGAASLFSILSLLTTFLCYIILDEIE